MKRPSFQDKADGIFGVYQAEKSGKKFKSGAKDGSIPTHPVVPCDDLPELGKGGVTDVCYKWLRARRIVVWRHETGAGRIAEGYGIYHYGIAGAGDLIGLLPDGRHFEVECKAGKGGRWQKNQQEHCKEVLASNGIYAIIHGTNELEYYWKRIEQENEL